MELEDLTRADLARKPGCSRARVTQLLNLLDLQEDLQCGIVEMGYRCDRQRVTERQLRKKLRRELVRGGRCPPRLSLLPGHHHAGVARASCGSYPDGIDTHGKG